ncbi:hypothetical protein HED52_16030 [Ochrobactrum ciceri]|uniref:Uncharacterized protein n=1 Tax=Brucella ciceri TaxID=391287 RepID=A0ABX1DZN1_9HYPH|nr:hypothetical protein [Brucella ciceri]
MSIAMLVPAVIDISFSNFRDAAVFLRSAMIAGAVALLLTVGFRPELQKLNDRRTGLLITVSAWLSVSAVGAIPLYTSYLGISWTDAVFESTSALTMECPHFAGQISY